MDAIYDPKTSARTPELTRGDVRGPVRRIATFIAERRRIGEIARELSGYTDRDLADMGLTRGDIPAVARGLHPRG